MTHFTRHKRKRRDVDLIPLVNIIFMLLFFFIIAGTVKEIDPLQVDIPNAAEGTSTKDDTINLSLTYNGDIYIDENRITKTELPEIIKPIVKENEEVLITIKADEKLKAKRLTDVIAIAKRSGVLNLALEIESN